MSERVDIFRRAGRPHQLLKLSYPINVEELGGARITLTPVKGKALICAVVVDGDN